MGLFDIFRQNNNNEQLLKASEEVQNLQAKVSTLEEQFSEAKAKPVVIPQVLTTGTMVQFSGAKRPIDEETWNDLAHNAGNLKTLAARMFPNESSFDSAQLQYLDGSIQQKEMTTPLSDLTRPVTVTFSMVSGRQG